MSIDPHAQRILILDFGSQYTQLIARRVREAGVYSEIYSCHADPQAIKSFAPQGVILSGGPESVTADDTPRIPDIVWTLGVPVLGVCYGMQAMALQLGGKVDSSAVHELGYAQIGLTDDSWLQAALKSADIDNSAPVDNVIHKQLDVWMSHGDQVTALPQGFEVAAQTADCPIAAMQCAERQLYGVQFHPEVTHTQYGQAMIGYFIHELCGCESLWTDAQIISAQVEQVRQQVGKDKVLLGLSGGVDSSVTAALLHKAIGEQLVCVFVDHGLCRLGEVGEVRDVIAKHLGVQVIFVDAAERFFNALAGVDDPEQKRKIIGREFVHVFQEQAEQLEGIKWLAQGTIYPDVIESAGSATGKAHVIKSHHNVGGLPDTLHLKLLEPLRELFKDEVRQIGEALGLPHALVYRHPFPGPALGVRVLGEVTPQAVAILQRADKIFIDALHEAGWYDKVAQAFAVFLPIKSVGVTGDARRYAYVIALRAVETVDFMTARWAQLPPELLGVVSNQIINEISDVSRVVYDISGKPPATIEWE